MNRESDQPNDAPAEGASTSPAVSRRQLVIGGAVVAISAACGTPTAPPANGGGTGTGGGAGGGGTGGAGGADAGAPNRAPVWAAIPDQVWVVGVPVNFDLSTYCTDPDGNALTFTLEGALPTGLALMGSVIKGTPLAPTDAAPVSVTADDGVV